MSNYAIFCLTEIWLRPNIGSSDYFPPGFVVYRRDRDLFQGAGAGGGVLVAVDSSRRRQDLENFPESLFVEIEYAKRERVLIGLFYLPPEKPPGDFQRCLVGLEKLNELQACNVLTDNFY